MNIQMVDLISQYNNIKDDVDQAVIEVMSTAKFIKGPAVKSFEQSMCEYLKVKHTISCANGTDALQIALMALNLQEGDEVIVPAFTYVATAEVIGLLKLKPVMVDVDPNTFNITAEIIKKAISPKTKVIVPVHLYGQSSDMEAIMELANKQGLYVIEDNAQAIGADYTFSNGAVKKTGTIGHIGCTSFFPSKNLGCYGDGGAIFTNDDKLASNIRMVANHGQAKKYYHSVIGVNSRLDSMQAAVLNIKLKKLDEYSAARQKVATAYDVAFKNIPEIQTPVRQFNSTHVFHQYTMQVAEGKRNTLQGYLKEQGIPSMIYYPLPLYKQEAFETYFSGEPLAATEILCEKVLSLPIHTEMKAEDLEYIISKVKAFFKVKSEKYFSHETAVVDEGCEIGEGTKIWHFSHIMPNAKIGKKCNIGQNVVISPDVILGDNVKVQNNVSIYKGVICEDDVFLGPSMVFTNVINPRSAINRKNQYAETHVGKGVSIGANATIVCGHNIGEYAFIGAGAVVTKTVPPYALMVGNPARQMGWISEYGHRLNLNENGEATCSESGQKYILKNNQIQKLNS